MNKKIVKNLLAFGLLAASPLSFAATPEEASGPKEVPPRLTKSFNPWKINSTLITQNQGFQVQTEGKDPQTKDPLGSINYSTSPSLEGAITLSYHNFGFTYRHTLISPQLTGNRESEKSRNEELRFNLFFDRHLFEFSRQNAVGLETNLEINKSGLSKNISRPDISYSDLRARWVYGLPLTSATQPNSLANFYGHAEIDKEEEFSVDILISSEASQQQISGASSFIPIERQSVFGRGSSLSGVSATGLGLAAGAGLTVLMGGQSYFSMATLVGGNYNVSRASFADRDEDASGFGLFVNVRTSVQFTFGEGNHHSLGFKLLLDSWSIPARDTNVASNTAALSMNYGIRF